MTLPDFIGIGVQKGGTSWLHKQLVVHPQVFIPPHRKEIHFFDVYFDRDVAWYRKFFNDAKSNQVKGEITPSYIYDAMTCDRLHEICPHAKLIVMLRHPVERAYSHYCMTFQSGEGQKYKSFDDFMTHHPHGFKRGLYGEQLLRWFDRFDRSNFLILLSEETSNSDEALEKTFDQISDFLNIDPSLFDRELAQQRVGQARPAPRFTMLAKLAQKTRLLLRDLNMDFVASTLKKIGITRALLGQGNVAIPPLNDDERAKWLSAYQKDIQQLEKLLDRSFQHWT